MASFSERMIGAAMLNADTYEEVEADSTALGQAMGVVVLSSVASGIGSLGYGGITGLVVGTIAALVGWFIWAALSFLIGTKLLPEPQTRSDVGELLRTIGFAASPGILRVAGFVPLFGWLITLVANLWMLAAMVIAVRQALDYRSTGRAIAVCVIGFIVNLVLASIFGFMSILGVAVFG